MICLIVSNYKKNHLNGQLFIIIVDSNQVLNNSVEYHKQDMMFGK